MAVGDTTDTSIIWVPGESTGRNVNGGSVALPEDVIPSGVLLFLTEDFATEDYVDTSVSDLASGVQDVANDSVGVLRAELVASGLLP